MYVKQEIPAYLLSDCYIPKADFTTNAGYEEWVDDVYFSLLSCAEAKKKIKELVKERKNP